ncbi:hypothetical protein B4096_1048 [Heyndrickxia coagulans]|nr:hypothetical protein B4096_1048 [Heyndrickxia coagulans]
MKIWAGFPKVPKENQPLEIPAYTGTDRIGFVPSPLMGSVRASPFCEPDVKR